MKLDSCGGKNHGCMRPEFGVVVRPERMCKIDGVFYTLHSIGKYSEIYAEARKINSADKKVVVVGGHEYRYYWSYNDKGAPARVKTATKKQRAEWPELEAWRSEPAWHSIHLLWVKKEGQAYNGLQY